MRVSNSKVTLFENRIMKVKEGKEEDENVHAAAYKMRGYILFQLLPYKQKGEKRE